MKTGSLDPWMEEMGSVCVGHDSERISARISGRICGNLEERPEMPRNRLEPIKWHQKLGGAFKFKVNSAPKNKKWTNKTWPKRKPTFKNPKKNLHPVPKSSSKENLLTAPIHENKARDGEKEKRKKRKMLQSYGNPLKESSGSFQRIHPDRHFPTEIVGAG